MKRYNLLVLVVLISIGLGAQSIWNRAHLEEVKGNLSLPLYSAAYQELIEKAEKQLTQMPPSVLMKEKTPASGNKHDYMSQARYYWPDPAQPDGKPYISRDGESNPELEKLDRVRLSHMATGVTTLSLAWYFSGDEKYAAKAVEFLQVWFLDEATRMNPHLKYAQMIPGRNNDLGRCYGVIDTYSFVEMLDAVALLEQSASFTEKDSQALKGWFAELLEWILTSEQGQEEANQANNHSVAHDAQVIAFALYTGNTAVAKKFIEDFPERRIFKQVEPDGSQPQELRRTLAFGYSQFNLHHFIDIFLMAQKIGLRIDDATSADGRNFYKAVDFLTPYLGKEVKDWPYQQISEWDYKQQELCKDLYRISWIDPSRTRYVNLYTRYGRKNTDRLFTLLYVRPTEVNTAYSFAGNQLEYALQCMEEFHTANPGTNKVSPRSIEPDGSLRVVGMHDWCSGFFPGSLWQLYAYTRDNKWKEAAESYTWPLEGVKTHRGTHDLGFMVYCPFGLAYNLTGDEKYREVFIQAAQTLATRYNDKVKSIRSWDFNKEVWQYPVIIDNMLNLELLFRAAEETGDSRYYDIAVNHANTTMKNHFREDHSSFHVVDYDTITGAVRSRGTHQGLDDASVWSRGQAWGLYGFTMCYRFTTDEAYLQKAMDITDFFFSQPNLADDLVPYWDMKDSRIPGAPRDASAAAIMASGMYELSTYVSAEKAAQYKELADKIVYILNNYYQAETGTAKGFLLLHSTGHHPKGDEIDVPISYADYYYLEALTRKEVLENK